MIRFSPHTRGCSARHVASDQIKKVFPAYAGMFRMLEISIFPPRSFPRIRGDVPLQWRRRKCPIGFSPHTRGCSAYLVAVPRYGEVFPAYAGMFLRRLARDRWGSSFPRIRGDVPLRSSRQVADGLFSPHTRGCSDATTETLLGHKVFPAYAGMFRRSRRPIRPQRRFPRIRGDVPSMYSGISMRVKFSPHTRGCSAHSGHDGSTDRVFPAYAGMFLG